MGTAREESTRVPMCWKRPAQRGMPPSGGWERRGEEEETGETRRRGAQDTSHAALPSPQGDTDQGPTVSVVVYGPGERDPHTSVAMCGASGFFLEEFVMNN